MSNKRDLLTEEIIDIAEPSVEEQIAMATRELEQRCNDLTQQIYYKQQEIEQLRKALDDQGNYFDKTVSNLIQSVFGPNNFDANR